MLLQLLLYGSRIEVDDEVAHVDCDEHHQLLHLPPIVRVRRTQPIDRLKY